MLPVALVGLFAGPVGGCFDGSQAEGLPCQTDEDCGPALSCQDSCCGGDCRDAPTTSPVTTEGTSTSTGTTMPSTTIGMTLEPTTSTTTSVEPCGDGFRDQKGPEPEECDDGIDANCEACMWVSACGNERLDDNEVCDPSSDSPGVSCAADCATDEIFAWNGERDGNPIDGLFETGDPSAFSWQFADSNDALGSGTYYLNPDGNDSVPAWPKAVLATVQLETGRSVEQLQRLSATVELVHRYQFNFDPDPPQGQSSPYVDHGRVFLQSTVASKAPTLTPILPGTGNAQPKEIACDPNTLHPATGTTCIDTTPRAPSFCDAAPMLAFAGREPSDSNTPFGVDVTLPAEELVAVEGAAPRLVFRAQYDCGNLDNAGAQPENNAWEIFEVKVTLRVAEQ